MIRTLVADDHPVVREGLKRILADCPDIELVGEAADGDETLDVCTRERPDVLVLDLSMPGPGFLETLRRLRESNCQARTLVLSVHEEEQFAVRCLEAGAAGYLMKDRSPDALADAIRHIARGQRFLSPSVAEQLAARVLDHPHGARLQDRLSAREYEIFLLIGSGKSVGEIATELGVSPKTVSTHRTRILDKTGLANNAQIIRYVIENRLLT